MRKFLLWFLQNFRFIYTISHSVPVMIWKKQQQNRLQKIAKMLLELNTVIRTWWEPWNTLKFRTFQCFTGVIKCLQNCCWWAVTVQCPVWQVFSQSLLLLYMRPGSIRIFLPCRNGRRYVLSFAICCAVGQICPGLSRLLHSEVCR